MSKRVVSLLASATELVAELVAACRQVLVAGAAVPKSVARLAAARRLARRAMLVASMVIPVARLVAARRGARRAIDLKIARCFRVPPYFHSCPAV